MLLVGFLKWWYGTGFRDRVSLVGQRLAGTVDFFSFAVISQTFFAPFREISNYQVQGSLGVQLRAWFDRLFSRVIGAILRTFVLLIGTVALVIGGIFGLLFLLFWGILPIFPLLGMGLFIFGVRIN